MEPTILLEKGVSYSFQTTIMGPVGILTLIVC